jgi:ABC-type multidrug transport system fused ATPase/permease subunit
MKNPILEIPNYINIFKKHLGSKIYIIFILATIASIAESVGILMLLPFFQHLDKKDSLSLPGSNSDTGVDVYLFISDTLHFFNIEGSTKNIIILITIMFVIKGVISFLSLGYSAILRGELLKKLKISLFKRYTLVNYEYFSSKDTGFFTNLINEQISRAILSFHHLILMSTKVLNIIIYILFAITINWSFGVMVVLSGIVMSALFKKLNNNVRGISRSTAAEEGFLTKLVIQALYAFKYLTSTGQLKNTEVEIINSIEKLADFQIKQGLFSAFTMSIREPIAVVFIMIIIFIQLVYLGQDLAPILVSVVLFYKSIMLLVGVQSGAQNMLEMIGSMELINSEAMNLIKNKEKNGVKGITSRFTGMEFINVNFGYDENKNTIQGLNFTLPPNKMIAIVGESGSGKSTLVDLITLVLKPKSGKITINNILSSEVDHNEWRDRIGFVSQDTVIFDTTVFGNIALNYKSKGGDFDIIKEKVINAAIAAHIHSFIESLPNGYDTLVGDRGIRLSGGQRQRLFIARELFRDPEVLILDEATSALDLESERSVQDSINKIKGKIAILIIAHRLSTIRKADMIFVMKNGEIIESGEYDKLAKMKDSYFKKMVEMHNL